MIGGIWLWLLVGTACRIWLNPASIVEKPAVAARSLIVLAVWKTTITLMMWFGGLSAAPDRTRASYLYFLHPGVAAFLGLPISPRFRSCFVSWRSWSSPDRGLSG